jgi:DNA repair protein RecO (recombination protein O)
MLETAERFTPVEKEPALRQLLLLIGGCAPSARESTTRDWSSTPSCCARSRWPDTRLPCRSAPAAARQETAAPACPGGGGRRLPAFAIPAGGMVCASCRPPGAASPAAPTVDLMLALLRGDWENADRSERRHQVECSGLVAAYLQWHLEHSIRSLRHVERV